MLSRRGQNIAEYSILIALVVAAAVAMQTYVKRGLQGRVKGAVDARGKVEVEGVNLFTDDNKQYEPYYAESDAKQYSTKDLNEGWEVNGKIARSGIDEKSGLRSGSSDKVLGTSEAD